ncbi:MAG: rhodanese-like domain-containing protein [Candidatus Aminicenantales bacterium]
MNRKIFIQALVIFGTSVVLGLGLNISILERFFAGEFAHGFLSEEEAHAITFITLEEAEDLFATQQALFIDSRSEEKFRQEHIPGAVNIPYETEPAGDIPGVETLPLDRELVVYCDGSECESSTGLARLLAQKGYLGIRVFFGGWKEWVDRGLPVSEEDEQP